MDSQFAMAGLPVGALLGRRLDRLRASAGNGVGSALRDRPDHATALAHALGGRVLRTHAGSLVAIEQIYEVPVDRASLATLPYPIDPGRPFVCLDLETTGLATAAGTLAFVVGLGSWDGDRLTVRQLVLPDHADERALLDALAASLPADCWLVTYNGRTFDWPLLVARYRMHRRDPPPTAGHFDLLPVARQLWKHRLGSARLSTVEEAISDVVRADDLPGALIPERYFGYLRSRRGELLSNVIEHNRLDILSLARLLSVLASGVASPEGWKALHPGDLAGLARGYTRRRRPSEALQCVEAALRCDAWTQGLPAGATLHRQLSAERARLLARVGRREDAFVAWLEIAQRGGPGAALAWLHVARHREHVRRDAAGAIEACHHAAAVAERARAWGSPLLGVERDLARRLLRLRRRLFNSRRLGRGVDRAA